MVYLGRFLSRRVIISKNFFFIPKGHCFEDFFFFFFISKGHYFEDFSSWRVIIPKIFLSRKVVIPKFGISQQQNNQNEVF